MTAYILWYHSRSHGRVRFFVGSETLEAPSPAKIAAIKALKSIPEKVKVVYAEAVTICPDPMCHCHRTHAKPTWTYEKDAATVFDSVAAAKKVKKWCTARGYRRLKIEATDEPVGGGKKP
jgi:hypothetical protein